MTTNIQADGSARDILDLSRALENVGGDHELLEEIAVLFLDDSEARLRDIRHAILTRDAELLQRAAHTLRGSVSNFGGERVASASQRLEYRGRSADWEGAERDLESLETELGEIRPLLQRL